MYFSILEYDDHNCAGALGIANILNEYDKTSEAKEIYKLLVNSEPNSVTGFHARVNQAHITMWEKNYDLAVNLYTSALEFQPENLEVSLYLSKALFKKKDYDGCKELLLKKLHRNPNDSRISYNLAHVLYNSARDTFNLPQREVHQSKKAIEDLKAAKSLFTQFLIIHSQFGGQQH